MKRLARLARLCKKGGRKNADPPLAAQLDNPYSPVFRAPRRFEELTRPQREQQSKKP